MKKQHILISRTDAIGDVVLTLPVCGLIKATLPSAKISFLGNSYTKDIVNACEYVDSFIDYDEWKNESENAIVYDIKKRNLDAVIHVYPEQNVAELTRKAGIPTRIGTTNRLHHWFNCNKLIQLSRRNSNLHESQLNIRLLKGLEINENVSLGNIHHYYGLCKIDPLNEEFKMLLSKDKFNLILHPKSRGSGKEWSLENYSKLIDLLNLDNFKIFITGSSQEKTKLADWIKQLGNKVSDVTGMFSLSQFLAFISNSNGLLASGTGPVHLAAAIGINSLGLYPNTSPIFAKRWRPLGIKAAYIEASNDNINTISPITVYSQINSWQK